MKTMERICIRDTRYTKIQTVKNITSDKNGDEPCYVRMSVDILNSQGTPITDDQALNLIYKTIYFD